MTKKEKKTGKGTPGRAPTASGSIGSEPESRSNGVGVMSLEGVIK